MSKAIQRTTASLITDNQLTRIYDTVELARKILRNAPKSSDPLLNTHCSEALLKLDTLSGTEAEQ